MGGLTFVTKMRLLIIGSLSLAISPLCSADVTKIQGPPAPTPHEIVIIGGEKPAPQDPFQEGQRQDDAPISAPPEEIIMIGGLGRSIPPPDSRPSATSGLQKSYSPQSEFTLKPGNKRTLESVDIMIPVMSHPEQDILFVDLRGVKDNKSGREFNAGLGYRRAIYSLIVADDPVIFGGYGYYDVRQSPNGFTYRQGTLGLEALHPWWQVRVNGYYPDRHQHVVPGSPGYFSGYSYILSSGKEGAMPGFDFEFGVRLPFVTLPTNQELFLFAGGYEFKRPGYPTIRGPQFRAEYWIYGIFDWLGLPNARLKIGGETSHDDVRGTNSFFELGLLLPLNVSRKPVSYNAIDRTLTLPVRRDVDIQSATTSSLLSTNGTPVTFRHVRKGSVGGDGTAAHPYGTPQEAVDDAIAQNVPNPVVYVHASADPYTADGESVIEIDTVPPSLKTLTLISPASTYTRDNGTISPSGPAAIFKTTNYTGFNGGSVAYKATGVPLILNGLNLQGSGAETMGVSASNGATMILVNSTVSSNGNISNAIAAIEGSTVNVLSSSASAAGTDSTGIYSSNSNINISNSSVTGAYSGVYGTGSVINATTTTIGGGTQIVQNTTFNFIDSSATGTPDIFADGTSVYYLYGRTPTMTSNPEIDIQDRRPKYPWQY